MARPYPRQHSNSWWLRRRPYAIFMLREWSSVFVAVYMVLLLVLVSKVRDGAQAYEDYLDFLQSPLVVVFHLVALAFALLHTVTWFVAVPKAMPLRRGEERVPPRAMIGANYLAWAAVSVVIVLFFLLD
jgi:fumarate reductase subunit C